ncbi:MAG: ribosome small subunit-dependent GTPase A [Saprospiraceae bacterium]|nr:ribosome small subunit-dependent GTPase A [Saprospiraceae bacterium]
MELKDLGFTKYLSQYCEENNLQGFEIARISSEHKDRYTALSVSGVLDCELLGNLRFAAESRYDLPAVGDWVAVSLYDDNKGLIHKILPRHSIVERQAVGKASKKQIIATNIDVGIIVLSVNRDFSINRVERYLTICNASKISPLVVLTKIDLVDESLWKALLEQLNKRIDQVPVIPISNLSGIGIDRIKSEIKKGQTYCLLGSSGVGKSTLLNNLIGEQIMDTGEISEQIDRGKHVTSYRELFLLDQGGIILDNPGMREVGITESKVGLEFTFEEIFSLASECKFNDCTHTNEVDCAILEALDNGDIDPDSYDNFQKMNKERAHFESSIYEKRQKGKQMSKMIRTVLKNKKKSKF